MIKLISVISTLASLTLGLVTSDTRARVTNIHVSSDTDTGSIVKTFPHDLSGLSLLQSQDSEKFYLLNNGDLMLARPLDCKAGNNISLALTHHVLNQTVLHLLNVHVHNSEEFLKFDRAEYVFSVRENQPPGTWLGSVTLSDLRQCCYGYYLFKWSKSYLFRGE